MKGNAHGTGDVNFAAAAMAVGIPLDERQVIAVKRDNGHDYVRWFLGPVSIDGRISVNTINRAWSDPGVARQVQALEGFAWVMDFIASRPDGVRTGRDWMTWAHDYLRSQGKPGSYHWPRKLEDVADFVALHPDDEEGHVFAFLLNRDLCIHLAKQAEEDPRLMFSKGGNAYGMLRENSPQWRKDQFFRMIG